jgi:tetratricopeptide (TPR) repeat protein
MRTRWGFWAAVLLLLGIPAVGFAEAGACDPWAARIASVQGEVEARGPGAANWHAVRLNDSYCPGDTIRVGKDSRAGLILANETLLRLDQHSAITLAAVEPDGFSLLEMLQGVAHFISRVPRSLRINTPFVNAAIEGTEFVVAVEQEAARITVFEGTVLAENPAGEVRVTANETVVAERGAAPGKRLVARPRDAVQWALYYPPVLDPERTVDPQLREASMLLQRGRVDAARPALEQVLRREPGNGDARALLAVIAVVQNRKDEALRLAEESVRDSPQSAAPRIALSYARQAHFDLEAALAAARQAVDIEPGNALAWARLAELQLSLGRLDDALASAQEATRLRPDLARTQSILGYAHLTRIRIGEAMAAFEKAIELDQADPLPRLGLGLAKIRRSRLTEGRRDIEIAASLDPDSAIIRSYLGKAYYEEKRAPLDAEQFAMARELDPLDPTPYFYDAIRKQTENRPVEALEDIHRSIELNDNRAVYRSSLQLDQDEAARGVSLAGIYADLGFGQRALFEASRSTALDPSSYSAHRFLADSYLSLPRHEMARASELLRSQLLQPVNTLPIQPQMAETHRAPVGGAGPLNASLSDLNPLFTRNGMALHLNAFAGSHGTFGDDLILAGIHDRFSYSLGQFHYETDGYRPNNDLQEDIYNLYLQYAFTPRFNMQLELRRRETESGDLDQLFDPDDFSTDLRRSIEQDTARLGARYRIDNRSNLIVSYIHADRSGALFLPGMPTIEESTETAGHQYEAQYLYDGARFNVTAGIGRFDADTDGTLTIDWTPVFGMPCPPSPPFPPVPCVEQESVAHTHDTAYVYADIRYPEAATWTLGASYDSYERDPQDISEVNPKLGLQWQIAESATLRAAYFETVKRALVVQQTIEPTHVAGFNQFFDDANGSLAKRYGLGLDWHFGDAVLAGIEASRREVRAPQFILGGDFAYVEREEDLHRAYLYWAAGKRWAFGAEARFESIDRTDLGPENWGRGPGKLETVTVPVRAVYRHPNGLFGDLTLTHVDQKVELGPLATFPRTSEQFALVDLGLGYRLPKRAGSLGLRVQNLFDEDFIYQDLNFMSSEPSAPRYLPERTVMVRINLNF